MSIPLTTYRNSIDEAVLRLLVIATWVPTESVEEISEDHLAKCVEERARVELGDYDLCRIEFELKDVRLGTLLRLLTSRKTSGGCTLNTPQLYNDARMRSS